MSLLGFWKEGFGKWFTSFGQHQGKAPFKRKNIFSDTSKKRQNDKYWVRKIKYFLGQFGLDQATYHLAVFWIVVYKVVLSPWMGGCCRYVPSCSEYALESFKTYPFFKAFSLSFKRVLRCCPFGPFGDDPVLNPSSKRGRL